jgi:hypothetical protein
MNGKPYNPALNIAVGVQRNKPLQRWLALRQVFSNLSYTVILTITRINHMKIPVTILAAVAIGLTIVALPAIAGSDTDALATCLADNTTGKDRKDMARWVFVGMSAHPEIRSLSNVTEKDRDELDKTMAALLTKLIVKNCPSQAKTAMQNEGNAAFQAAFGTIGKLAMQELMSNTEVNSSFSRFSKYLDKNKIDSVSSNK